MKCFYHPERDSTHQCALCGKQLCPECVYTKEDLSYCIECMRSSVNVPHILISAVSCGTAAGILSALPWVNLANCFFCLWIVVGGGLSVFVAKKISNTKGRIRGEQAVLIGGLTGVVASLVMWGVYRVEILSLFSEDYLITYLFMFPLLNGIGIFTIGARTLLFAVFGGVGGVILNRLLK